MQNAYLFLHPIVQDIEANGRKVKGIGAPNANHFLGVIDHAPNLPWKGVILVVKKVKEKFNLPAILDNDANAATIGKMMYENAKKMKDFIIITLGTWVGAGVVCNGQLVYGHDNFAGELGHIVVIPDGRLHYSTGIRGTLESYCSATGMLITAKEMLEKKTHVPSLLRHHPIQEINSKLICEYAKQGDAISLEIYKFTSQILGIALANYVMFTSPEAIFFFGGPSYSGDLLLVPAKERMEENLLSVFKNKVNLYLSGLEQGNVAILGASALVWKIKK